MHPTARFFNLCSKGVTMVPRWVSVLTLAAFISIAHTAAAQDANGNGDGNENVLAKMQQQLEQMQKVIRQLHNENQQLRQALQGRVQPSNNGYTNIFPQDSPHVEFYPPAGAAPPSWIDAVIEANRQRHLQDWAQQRANERIVDQRILQIRAESRAIGARYAPRPLREAVLAGADPKATRDKLETDRTADFNDLISQPAVQDFLKIKVALIEQGMAAVPSPTLAHGYIADANVYLLAERLRQDVEDASILYGDNNGGFKMGLELTREQRDSANVAVSGPTRETIAQGHRQNAIDAANSSGTDLDAVLRQQAVTQIQKLRAAAAAATVYNDHDVNLFNGVLNGKFSRTHVPHVQSASQPNVPQN